MSNKKEIIIHNGALFILAEFSGTIIGVDGGAPELIGTSDDSTGYDDGSECEFVDVKVKVLIVASPDATAFEEPVNGQ